jgi:CRP/FNR family transcriptional regulator, cyclic AMP receptor protein
MTGFEPLAVRQDWNRASDRDWVDVLTTLPLFVGIPKRRLRKIVQEADFAEFAPGDTVISVGAPADFLYVILGGSAEVTARPGARTLQAGDYFGEIALLNDGPRTASVVATDDLHVMRLPRRTFLELLGQKGVAARMLAEFGDRVRRLERQR